MTKITLTKKQIYVIDLVEESIKMKRTIIGFICLLFIFCSLVFSGGPGTTTASFLKIGVGARNIGMGETGSISEDANSIYWNPAGISSIKEKEVSVMHAVWLEEINYEHLVFAVPFSFGTFGSAVNYLSMGQMDKYDKDGNIVTDDKTFTASDIAVTLSYGKTFSLSDTHSLPLNIGLNLKYISSKIEEESATGFAADIGSQIKLKDGKLGLGLVVQNIGTGMKFIKETDSLPLNIKIGCGYTIFVGKTSPLLIALDVNLPSDNDPRANFGVEFTQKFGPVRIAPRLGYKTNTKGLEGLAGLTAGLGFNIKSYYLDYAFVPYGQLGDTHRISFSIKF